MNLKIEYINKEQLKPYKNNAKIHTDSQIEQIKNSIREFGFNDPIAVWHDNEIIEGHGRLLAVMDMPEIEKIPVIRLDELSNEQRRAYMLAHNKLTMNTEFDLDILNLELDDIANINMDDFGFFTPDFDVESFFEDKEPEKTSSMPVNNAESENDSDVERFSSVAEEDDRKQQIETGEKRKIRRPHCGEWFEI